MKRKSIILRFLFIALTFVLLLTPINYLVISKPLDSSSSIEIDDYSSWSWSSYEVISETSTDNSYLPDVFVDINDNLHVVWQDNTDILGSGTDQDIFYRFFDSSLETWGTIELVSSESDDTSRDPIVSVDQSGDVHVVWRDSSNYLSAGTEYDIFYKKKNYGGSWTITTVISEGSNSLVEGFSVVTDIENNVYITWADYTIDLLSSGIDVDLFGRYYNSTTSTWSSEKLITASSTGDSSHSYIAIDSLTGELHVVWIDSSDLLGAGSGDFDVFYCKWNFATSLMTDLTLISTGSDGNSLLPKLAFDQNHFPHVTWTDQHYYFDSDADLDIHYRYKDWLTGIWSEIELISTESPSSSDNPEILIDKENCVFIIWDDYSDIFGANSDNDVFFKYKHPSFNEWSSLEIVSIESELDSYHPQIAIDSSGFVYCLYSELDNLGNSGADADIFYRKFAGVPSATSLSIILPNPSSSDEITLSWNEVISAEEYLVYRSKSFIYSISSLEPLATVTNTTYLDTVNETGTYFYAILGQNEYGYGALSNVEHVIVESGLGGLFTSLSLTEILIIAGVALGFQIIGSIITYSLVKGSVQSKGKSKKGKKK